MRPRSALAALVACLLLPLAHAASKYRVLHNFGAPQDGAVPAAVLVFGNPETLYGVAGGPGPHGNGTVFELEREANGTWTENVLYSFKAGSDGAFPYGNLLLDSTGNLFGTVQGYGSFAVGGVFELTPGDDGWSNTVIYTDGAGPGLLSDEFGNLYGQMGPGIGDYGALGELSPGSAGWTYNALADFSNSVGWDLLAPPIWDDKGDLFGVTYEGGIGQPACVNVFGCGVAFEMTPNSDGTWDYYVLHKFASSPTDGKGPAGGLVMGQNGELYGVTVYGGVYKNGRVFQLRPVASGADEWAETAVYDFPHCALGCLPAGTMVFDQAGDLYGVASGGKALCGGFTCGVVFKLSPRASGSWSYSVVHAFTGKDGSSPVGVIVDNHGNLFGTTTNGGTYNTGVAFEITP